MNGGETRQRAKEQGTKTYHFGGDAGIEKKGPQKNRDGNQRCRGKKGKKRESGIELRKMKKGRKAKRSSQKKRSAR